MSDKEMEQLFDKWAAKNNFDVSVELYMEDDYLGIHSTELNVDHFWDYIINEDIKFSTEDELMGIYEKWMEDEIDPNSDWYREQIEWYMNNEYDEEIRAYEIKQDMAYDMWKDEHGW